MTQIQDLLRGELERHFDLDELKALSAELLGYSTDSFDSVDGKGPFARALVDRACGDHAVEALADAMRFFRHERLPELEAVFATRQSKALKIGTEIGGFTIEGLIAEGGLGRVYRAKHAEHGSVALKVIRSSLSRDESAVQRWLTTQRAYRRAAVPGVGAVHDCGLLEASGQPWVAVALAEGETLEKRIAKSGAVHLREAWSMIDAILTAIHALHEAGLVHSDVKAGNVFVGAKAEDAMVVDGGTYRLLAAGASKPDAVGALRVFGKAQSIPPELARGEAVTALGDVYGAGVLVYQLVTGKTPFDGGSAFDVIAKHLEVEVPAASAVAPRGFVSKAVDEVLAKALAKDPADRFPTVKAFRDALARVARPEAVELDQKAFDKAKKALEKKPSDENAAKLEEIVDAAHAWKKAVEVFSGVAEKAKGDDKKALLHRAARIQSVELADTEAAEGIYRSLLELDEADSVARGGLEELRRSAGDFEGLSELLLEKAELLEGRLERAAVLREIAEIYETKLDDADNALVAWSQALSDDPSDARTVRAIERICEGNAEHWNEVLAALTEAVAEPEDEADAVRLYVLMGRWYAEELSRPDFAVPCFAQALQLDPTCDPAYDGAITLYRQAQSWQEYVQLLDQRAASARNPVAARRYGADAAAIVFEQLGNADDAVARYTSILEGDPAHPEASVALAEIYETQKRWKELAEVLDERTRHASGDAKIKAMLELGEVYEDYLDDLEQATAHYEGALALDGARLDTLKALERVHARRNDYPELLAVLQKQLEVVATPRQRIAVLTHMGAIYEEEFVDIEKAIAAYEEVVSIDAGSEEANPALARLYRSAGRFDDLIVTLDRHAESSDERRKIDLMLKAAHVLMEEVGAPERALEHCEKVLELDAKNVEALGLAAKLRAQVGDVAAAVEAAEKLAKAAEDPAEKAAKYVEVGKILEEREDNDKAISAYKRALDADEDHKPASDALRRLYAARGDAQGASELLLLAIEKTDGKSQKATLYAELGSLYATRLKDDAKATEAFKEALSLDGTCTPALRGFGHMAYANEKYQEAAMRLEPLLARSGEMDVEAALQVALECGDSLRRMGEHERAQTALFSAKALAPNDPSVLSKLAEASFFAEQYEDAADLYGELLEKAGDKLTPHERGQALLRLGESHRDMAEYDMARDELLEAQKLLPGDTNVLEALRRVHEKREDWKSVAAIITARLDSSKGEERVELLIALGDVQQQRLDDRQAAAKSYVEAMELLPEDRNLLSKLMGVYSESKDWAPLIEVILKIAALVENKAQQAKYYLTAASIFTHELSDDAEATRYYNQALAADATLERAFDGLVRVLGKTEDWGGVAEAYEAQLARLQDAQGNAEARAKRYDELGELYRDRLGQPEKAAEAFEAAHELDPERRERLETLAELYDEEPSEFRAQGLRTHRRLLKHNPFRAESYRALYDLLDDSDHGDGAWCVSQTLHVLNLADPEVDAVYREGRKSAPATGKNKLAADTWGLIQHPDVHPVLAEIFDVIAPAVLAGQGQTLATYDVSESDKRDAKDKTAIVAALHAAAKAGGLKVPALYTRKSDPGGLAFLFTEQPAVGIGQAALVDAPAKALTFIAARHLAYYRGGMIMRRLVPSGSSLRTWLLASMQLVTPGFVAPSSVASNVKNHRKSLDKHLKPGPRDRLRGLVQRLLDAEGEVDTTRWIATVDFTADRMGLLLADDLGLAKTIIEATPEEHVSNQDRLRELYLFSVSEEYFALRKKLGL